MAEEIYCHSRGRLPPARPLRPHTEADAACPGCGGRGRAIEVVTLKSLLRPDALTRLDPFADHRFCHTPGCPVVYWSSGGQFVEADLRVGVFQKASADPLPVCYCFGFPSHAIEEDARRCGHSSVLDTIKQHVAAGRCACDLQNPQGSCCLGDVAAVVKGVADGRRGDGMQT